ncbi:MAG TPA: AMP-binding protein [Pseudomonadales bacterium]|nr:AMP-binding protein [Pseudomonadales bacterium]
MKTDPRHWPIRINTDLATHYRQTGVWPNQTIAEFARHAVERDPHRITHVFEGQSYRIEELLMQAESLAASLQNLGLITGDVIAFQLPNWVETMVIDLAAALLGLVVVPIVPIYREAEVAYILADCGAKMVFVPGDYRGHHYLAMMAQLQQQLPKLERVVSVRVYPAQSNSYEALVSNTAKLTQHEPVDPNSVKLIQYTSGTTGSPKGVLHSHNTLASAVMAAGQHWGLQAGETMLMASPVTHVTGFGSGLELPLLCDMRTVFMERWSAAEGVKIIERERVNISMGATPFLQELLTEAERTGNRLPSLRFYACGGAAVPPSLIYKAHDILDNCMAFRVYGASEVPLVTMGFVQENQLRLAAETDGEVVSYEIKIVDDDGRKVSDGEDGEILARGPSLFLGYTDAKQNQDCFDEEGFFKTGDIGHLNQENAIVITGRKKDLINRGGEKISAKEVEDLLHLHPAIEEAAVVAIPHERLGETVGVYVVLKPSKHFNFEEMVSHIVGAGVAKQKIPEKLEIVESFPRTASGKIRKDILRQKAKAVLNT